jgi:3-oxoacyl-[acyl-carrier protein] reductase
MITTLIVITGAASGIGRQLFFKFRDQKIPMILVDLDAEKLDAQTLETAEAHFVQGSVSEEKTWDRVIAKAKEIHLPISHLINCAGVIRPGFVADYALSDIDYHLDVNTKGSILGTTLIGREMKFQEFGHIINIASLAGLAPVSGLSLYTASKFAIRGFSLATAAELRNFGVSVSVVCPDLVNTPMLDLQLDYPEEAKLTFSGPSKVLQPENIVDVVLNLIEKPRLQVCVPESRGLLAKIAGAWPAFAEIFRNSLEKKGQETIKNLRK